MRTKDPIVIIGGGHAGVQAAASLREEGVSEPIVLITEESALPYERPPLSKKFLDGEVTESGLLLRDASFYWDNLIDIRSGLAVEAVDRARRHVLARGGINIAYSHLIFATGCEKRPLRGMSEKIDGVLGLRSLSDAVELRDRLDSASSVVVVGAGFIGMEFAAVAARRGCAVDVIDTAPRTLSRATTEMTSDYLRTALEKAGVTFHLGEMVTSIEEFGGNLKAVQLSKCRLVADIVLIGVGAKPRDRLAVESGLSCPNGISVDDTLGTIDPNVSAIGDCAFGPNLIAGKQLRLECVQNAQDQARVVAKKLSGNSVSYQAVPAFWSDIGRTRLQIAGLCDSECDRHVVRGNREADRFSIFSFSGGALRSVESINRPADHILARKLLASAALVSPDQVASEEFELKQLLIPTS